jgi:hypothetical protein
MSTDKPSLSQQEQLFIDYLFDGQQMRHPDEAKQLAGYPANYPVLKLVKKVKDELIGKYDDYLALYAPKGLAALMEVLTNPENPGSKIRLQAATELLDRAGVTKKDKTEQTQIQPNYIFYLPNKTAIEE